MQVVYRTKNKKKINGNYNEALGMRNFFRILENVKKFINISCFTANHTRKFHMPVIMCLLRLVSTFK
jgi:hypothetical protein